MPDILSPLGIEPRWSWEARVRNQRINDLAEAMDRYRAAGKAVPIDLVGRLVRKLVGRLVGRR